MRRVSIMDPRGMRAAILEALKILAQPSAQLAYEASLVQASHALSELVAHDCDDFFHPRDLAMSAEFTDDELKDLSRLYGLVAEAGVVNRGSRLCVGIAGVGVCKPHSGVAQW